MGTYAWDIALILVVTSMVAVMAALKDPWRKSLVLTLPIPFTIASLAVGTRIDTTHMAALSLLFLYTLAVYVLHRRLRLPLAASVVCGAGLFLGLATLLHDVLPRSDRAFWSAATFTLAAALVLGRTLRPRSEPARPSRLPLGAKIALALASVTFLVVIKSAIGGFMTLFPMVGVLASFENRHGLWSNVVQMPIVMLTMLPLLITSRLSVDAVGLPLSLALGWIPFTVAATPVVLARWRSSRRRQI